MSKPFFEVFNSVKIFQEVSTDSNTIPSPRSPTSSRNLNDHHLFTHLPVEFSQNLLPISLAPLNYKKKRKYQHTRRNSYLKQIRKLNKLKQQQLLQIYSTTLQKPTSHDLLCLWPLPTLTRYTIFLSFVVSLGNFLGLFELSCSSPTFVIHRLELINLFLSPFLCLPSFKQVLLFGWNILTLGLLEESLVHMLGQERFIKIFFSIVLSVCTLRQGIGYVFSKSTGWAIPSLFFSDALHECSQGLSPFLFALLVIQSFNLEEKYIIMYGHDQWTIRKITILCLMCLVNYTVKNILWWTLTGLITGWIGNVWIQCRHSQPHQTIHDDEALELPDTALWPTLRQTLQRGTCLILSLLPILLVFNAHHSQERSVSPDTLNQLSYDRYLFTFVIMTAPRRGDPPFLSRTLESYLQSWPEGPEPGSLYDRIQMLVYTHFSVHPEYDRARDKVGESRKGLQYVRWVREEGYVLNQREHVAKALTLAADQFQSTYIALVEDDFPVCGTKEWQKIQSVVYNANIESPNHCGIFVGTGGSGLFLKPKIAKLASGLLIKYPNLPPDIIIQQCLLGNLNECRACSQTLVTSKTLLMYHIGYNTSTSVDRSYKKNEFQCGWRHPFNGDPNVMTL